MIRIGIATDYMQLYVMYVITGPGKNGPRKRVTKAAEHIIIIIYFKKLQTIYLMLYKRQIKNTKNHKYKHERIR